MPLPAYCLLQEMERVAKSGFNIKGKNITTFNPDYRAWDAKTAVRYSRGRNVADIYFCKILCRPNSKEARQEYEKDNDITYRKRLHVRFDSRRFDLLHASQIDEKDQTGIGDLYKVNDNKRDLKEDYL